MKKFKSLLFAAALSVLAGSASAEVPSLTLNNGMKIPQLGCGVWELSGEDAYKSVSAALKIGYRLVDTAQYYRNEAEVYQAIVDSGIPRGEIFLMSKLNPHHSTESAVRQALDESLKKLGGYIDLMIIHWPTSADEMQWKILEEYQKAGKFGAIGLSNYHPDGAERILKIATVKPVLDQIELHPYYSRADEVPKLTDMGVVTQAWSPLGAGRQGLFKDPVLLEIAAKHGKTAAQVILAWDLKRGVVTIPRSRNPAHLKENFESADFTLDDEDMKKIDALNRNDAIWGI